MHGEQYALKETETWGDPDEILDLKQDRWGLVRVECWNGLHGKLVEDVPFDVIRAIVHLERDKPPKPIWLAWQAPAVIPQGIHVDAAVICQAYCHRWPIESNIHFR